MIMVNYVVWYRNHLFCHGNIYQFAEYPILRKTTPEYERQFRRNGKGKTL